MILDKLRDKNESPIKFTCSAHVCVLTNYQKLKRIVVNALKISKSTSCGRNYKKTDMHLRSGYITKIKKINFRLLNKCHSN